MCSHQVVFRYLLDKILVVIRGRAVTGKDAISSISRGRQCTEPLSVICTKIGVSIAIRWPHTCMIGAGYPPIMVATDGQVDAMSRSQTSRGHSGPETESPRSMVRSAPRLWMSASTASSAGRLPWISAMIAILIGLPAGHSVASGLSSSLHRCLTLPPQSHLLCQCREFGATSEFVAGTPPLSVPRTHSPIYGYDNRYLARANQPLRLRQDQRRLREEHSRSLTGYKTQRCITIAK